MPSIGVRAPARSYKVVVVGLIGSQFTSLQSLVKDLPIEVRHVSPNELLRVRHLDGLVLITRFAGHKHTSHAARIAPNRVIRVRHGAAQAVYDSIVELFGLGQAA